MDSEKLPIKVPGKPTRYVDQEASSSGDAPDAPVRPIRIPVKKASTAENKLKVGRMNRLKVVADLDFGVYLDAGLQGEILMPRKYVPAGCKEGDFVDGFVYLDSEDRLIATTETPYAMEGELAFLEVVASTKIGAFLDWGLMKDLLVPFREQRDPMNLGESYIVYIYYDTTSERLVASSKTAKFIDTKSDRYKIGEEVDLIVCNPFDLGYRVIIDKRYLGVIYSSEIFQEISPGQMIKGYIKNLRPEGKIDVELQRSGESARDVLEDKLLQDLRDAGGFLALTDRTDPDVIYQTYRVSKRAFKRAVGGLYKKRLVTLEDDGIRLL